MLDIVTRQDDDRLFAGKSAPQQGRANLFYAGKNLRICELAPFALRIALRQEQPIRRNFCPMFERLAEVVVIAAELLRGTDIDDATGALFDRGIEPAELDRTQRRGCLIFGSSGCTRHCRDRISVICAWSSARAFRGNS